MGNVLFEITKDHLETGLRGYPVGYCTTSSVDPQKGLFYLGRPIAGLAEKNPEDIIYLLYHGKDPSANESKEFYSKLVKCGTLSPEVIKSIHSLPRSGHPMKLLASALLICGMVEGKGDYQKDCLNIIAKIPELVAAVLNYHAGWKAPHSSDPSLGYIENFVNMLGVPQADKKLLTKVFKIFNILHYDHGGGNLSTFVGKAVASGLEDMYGSLSSAICALEGPRHGKANQDCLEFVKQILEDLNEDINAEKVEQILRDKLNRKELVYGFGHAVLRVEDPRATVFYNLAEKYYPDHPLVKVVLHLRKVGPKILKENPKIQNPYPNVDAVSGTILTASGFAYPQYFTVLFGMSRVVGIAMQIVYERCYAREKKGVPIYRPKYIYKEREDNGR